MFFRNLLLVSALFVQAETLYRAETRCFSENFCLFQPYLLIPKPYVVPKLGAFPKPFACFSLICSSRNPISCRNSVFFRNLLLVYALFVQVETLVFVELGAVVHQCETSARFRHQRNLQAFFVTFCLFAFWRN